MRRMCEGTESPKLGNNLTIIELRFEIGVRLVRKVGCGAMGGCGRCSRCGNRLDDGGNTVTRVMDVQGLQGNTKKGRGSGAQNIAWFELSTSRERKVLSARREETFCRLRAVGVDRPGNGR